MSVPPKVSRELADAVQEDALRAARDEAKHRAVRQMEGYDVFKNMVAVAHLRPHNLPGDASHMTAADRAAARAPAFSFTPEGRASGPASTPGASTPLTPAADAASIRAPSSAADFEKTWRRSCKSADARWRYLGLVAGTREGRIAKLFRVEINGTVLSELVAALAAGYAGDGRSIRDDDEWAGARGARAIGERVRAFLAELATCGRFALAAKLMASGAREAMRTLADALVANGAVDAGAAEALKSAYGCG